MKVLFIVVVALLLALGGFFAFNQYIYNEKQGDETDLDEAPDGEDIGEASGESEESIDRYFYDRMVTLGIEDVGHPIEGFDANLLVAAYPGLLPEDFDGVEAFEGHYELRGGEAVFVRSGAMPATSAESTISEAGYETLLSNLSARLEREIEERVDVDELISAINTAERIEIAIGESGPAIGVRITVHEVLEDSRCPIDVTCIWAGTVRVRATLESGLGTAEQVFELDTPITTEVEEVTLIQVGPFPEEGVSIEDSDYTFIFEIKKRQ
jgi:hypothetical protein